MTDEALDFLKYGTNLLGRLFVVDTMPNPSLIVVMPVYNEEACIPQVIQFWLDQMSSIEGSRLLLIDDGSKDGTGAILDRIAGKDSRLEVIHQKNGGHGNAVLHGYRRALEEGPTWIFQVDSDDQIPADDLKKLWDRRSESPFILGRRAKRIDPWHRLIISRINRGMTRILFGVVVRDPNVPFRLMKADLLQELLKKIPADTFAPNIFLTVLARKRGLDTLDIPVTHKIRESGTPSLNLRKLAKVCAKCVVDALRIRRLAA